MATTRPMNFSIPLVKADFIETKANRSAYIATLVENDPDFPAWLSKGRAKEQA